jgi:preprotein translocase subunit SecE
MNAKAEAGASGLDTVKLVMSGARRRAALWGFYFFANYSLLLRVVVLLAMSGGAVAIALTSTQGRQLWRFAVDARMEVRKVVWPTRQETMQTTLIVMVMVLILGSCCGCSTCPDVDSALPDRAGGLTMSKRWYVIHAFSGFESHVSACAEERMARAGMEDAFGEILVPTEEVVEMRNGQQRTSERKFFPGLRAGQYGNDRRDLAPGQGRAQGHGFHRRQGRPPAPIPDAQVDAILSVFRTASRSRAEGALRAGRGGPCHRRSVHGLQRRGRGGRLRQEPRASVGADLRPFHAGRAGVRAGREGLSAAMSTSAQGRPDVLRQLLF